MRMSVDKSHNSLQDRVHDELVDSVDEELELEIDDERLARLLDHVTDSPQQETIDRSEAVVGVPDGVRRSSARRSDVE
jgi:hypothetical protein